MDRTRLIYSKFAHLYPLFKASLGGSDAVAREVAFLQNILKQTDAPVRSIIDLGGGIGLHAGNPALIPQRLS